VCQSAQIPHPNILQIHDVQTSCEYPFVVTELCSNGSVRRLISDASVIPVNLSLKYLIQSLHALKAAHKAGLIHRGLKPENLLLDKYGSLKISDFSFSKIVERDQNVIKQVFVGMGSVGYMAPELFQDPKMANAQSDIYALGIIFYEMLTRKIPGRRSKMPSQIDSRIPSAIDDIFDNMTHDEMSQRYSSVDDILEDFEKIEDFGGLIGSQTQILQLEDPLAELEFNGSDDGLGGSSSTDDGDSEIAEGEGKAAKKTRRPYSYQQRNKK
jgi:serine/threonine-protein kinase